MAVREFSCMLVAAALGCSPEPPELAADANLILRGPEDVFVCAGTFARSSAEVVMIRESFRPSSGPVEYIWMPETEVSAADFPCESSNYACTSGTSIYARTLASTHEIVHAARSPGLPMVLEEGLAAMLDEATPQEQVLAPRIDFEQAVTSGSWSPSNALYERSAHFVSFLVAWGGLEALRELERAFASWTDNAYTSPPAQLDEAMVAVYGLNLAEVLAEYETYPDCAPAQFHQALSACELLTSNQTPGTTVTASLIDDGEVDPFLMSIDCSHERAYGPVDRGVLTVARDVKVEVELPLDANVWVRLRGEAGEGAVAWLSNCGDCWSGSGAIVSMAEPAAFVRLESGPHVLTLHQSAETGELGIELSY